ncbi:rhodanese-like domain-containing protein [Orbus sturtevantii]|uniref:rhodanese-like domain-containing protein n=1 Tax=Orbus sturtevantii TaxID=3074109 RepID=UPI00370D79BC
MNIQEITSKELADKLKADTNDIFLLDVREDNEVDICSIDGANHIAMSHIPLYLDRIPDDKIIVIYCHHGIRSVNVASFLIYNGFDEHLIYSLKQGIDGWALTIDNTMNRY